MLQFAREISKPVSEKEAELEYVPTQLLAEYIRKLGYKGIIFSSSVNPGGKNYVLFYGPAQQPPQSMPYYGGCDVLAGYTDILELKQQTYERVTLTPQLKNRLFYSGGLSPEQEKEPPVEREAAPV